MDAARADADDRPEIIGPAQGHEELATERRVVLDELLEQERLDRRDGRGARPSRRWPRSPGPAPLDDLDRTDVRLVGETRRDGLDDHAIASENRRARGRYLLPAGPTMTCRGTGIPSERQECEPFDLQ